MSEYIVKVEGQMPDAIFERELTEIVRCRDCANYHDGISQYTGRRFAEPHCLAIGELAYGALFDVDENDFCSWAERREQ